jgi:hypothetical protein
MEIIFGAIGLGISLAYTLILIICVAVGTIGLIAAMRYHWLRSNERFEEAARLKEKFNSL